MTDPSALDAGDHFGRLVELVEVQKGAVVSRTLMKSDGGNLTLFAFDKDEGLSEHTTPKEAIIWVLQGRMEAVIGGDPYLLNTGDFIRLPANVPHSIQALEQLKLVLVLFE